MLAPRTFNRAYLQEEFAKLVLQFEIGIRILPTKEERDIGTQWLDKLIGTDGDLELLKLRNDYMYYLSQTMGNSCFAYAPFNKIPSGCLSSWKHFLPSNYRWWRTTPFKQREVFEQLLSLSETGSNFLRKQPVPKHGTFSIFYIHNGPLEAAANECDEQEERSKSPCGSQQTAAQCNQPCDNQQDDNQQDGNQQDANQQDGNQQDCIQQDGNQQECNLQN